ncbi:MAG: response regulator [Chitinophagaceae bacterium]|nr:response regulator [Oligoflexus sp.]
MLVTTIKKYLRHLGFRNVDTYLTGNEAWKAMQNETYQVVVMDWKLRGVSGLSFYNRIRSHPRMSHTPTVILCGFAGKEDFRILEEISSTSFLEKPFQFQIFEKAMNSTSVCSSLDIQLSEIAGIIIDHSKSSSSDLLKEIVAVAKTTGYQFKFLVASGSYFMHLRQYLRAEAIWELATKLNPKSVLAMTELAKTNLRLNRPVKSLALLETDKARAFFERALQIDDEQPIAQAGLTVANNLKEYLDLTKENKPFNLKLASTLNVVGMAFVCDNQVDKGIEQHKSALCFIHDPAMLARLQFNLGLAYLGKGDMTKAQNYMFESMANADLEFIKPEIFHSKIVSGMTFRNLADPDYADTLDLSDYDHEGLTV